MFLLDSNVLIEAKNRYYGFDFHPGFWSWLEQAHHKGLITSLDAVARELRSGNDELAQWTAAHPLFFEALTPRGLATIPRVSQWAYDQNQYSQAALNAFSSSTADFRLIAHAAAEGHTLVTHERRSPHGRNRVKIPDICAGLNVPTVDTFDMLRKTGARFIS